jgi:hypothetical protein
VDVSLHPSDPRSTRLETKIPEPISATDTRKQIMNSSVTPIPPESHGKIRRESPYHQSYRSSS